MKTVKLSAPRVVGGQIRYPIEGPISMGDDEADRIVADKEGSFVKPPKDILKGKSEGAGMPGDPTKAALETAQAKGFAIVEKAGGWHEITGPGIPDGEPLNVQGDEKLIAKLTELTSGTAQG